jgi:hypothetical protein
MTNWVWKNEELNGYMDEMKNSNGHGRMKMHENEYYCHRLMKELIKMGYGRMKNYNGYMEE